LRGAGLARPRGRSKPAAAAAVKKAAALVCGVAAAVTRQLPAFGKYHGGRCRGVRSGDRQNQRRGCRRGANLCGADGHFATRDAVSVAIAGADVNQLETLVKQLRSLQLVHRLADELKRKVELCGHRRQVAAAITCLPDACGGRAQAMRALAEPVVDEKLISDTFNDQIF
jgi:hypothetical protein